MKVIRLRASSIAAIAAWLVSSGMARAQQATSAEAAFRGSLGRAMELSVTLLAMALTPSPRTSTLLECDFSF